MARNNARPARRTARPRRSGKWVTFAHATQTVNTGTAILRDMIVSGGQNGSLIDDHNEIYVKAIQGYLNWYPNLSSYSLGNGTFEGAAAYAGIKRVEKIAYDQGIVAVGDLYLYPDHPWLWSKSQKGLWLGPAAGISQSYGPEPPLGWQVRWRGNVMIEDDQALVAVYNYTDDGSYNASSWWAWLRMYVEWN